ncbi:hypothetical protein DBR42_15280 [Pelomonas sp. HMWF004]|nr:hypothetical protein DBR42_15280 [Pelomonas sp. HMWF004]
MHAAVQSALFERHYIQFHPVLAELLGGFKPALMLGHALYWTRNWMMTQASGRDGWFWKTAAEWRDATGLTPREQEGARQVLRDAGIWQEALIGQAHGHGTKLHFRVDLAALTKALCKFGIVNKDSPASVAIESQHPPVAPVVNDAPEDGPASLTRLLATPVLYYRSLADVAGGPASGLLLSWLLNRMRDALQRMSATSDGFFLFELDNLQQRLRLGPKVLRNARDTLERIGLISVGYAFESRGRLMVRVNLLALTACLSGQKPGQRKRVVAGRKLEPVIVQEALLMDNEPANRAQVVSQDSNVTHVGRILFGRPVSAPQASPAGPAQAQPASRKTLRVAAGRFAVLSKRSPQDGMSTCRFVETGGAVLSNLYTKVLDTKPTTPTVGAGKNQKVDEVGLGRSRRSLDLPFGGDLPRQPASEHRPLTPRDDLLPRAEVIAASVTTPRPAPPARPVPMTAESAVQVQATGAVEAGSADLIMPKRLDAALHDAARTMVLDAPAGLRQAILDELEGNLASKRKSIESPLGWLNAVVTKACQGTLKLTVAHTVAQTREAARRQVERQQQAQPSVQPAQEAAGQPAQLSAEGQAARDKLKALTDQMRAGLFNRKGGQS